MSIKPNPVHIMITGGTIDSYDKLIHYPLPPKEKSIVPTYLENLKLRMDIKFTGICYKDSRDLSKADLAKLSKA